MNSQEINPEMSQNFIQPQTSSEINILKENLTQPLTGNKIKSKTVNKSNKLKVKESQDEVENNNNNNNDIEKEIDKEIENNINKNSLTTDDLVNFQGFNTATSFNKKKKLNSKRAKTPDYSKGKFNMTGKSFNSSNNNLFKNAFSRKLNNNNCIDNLNTDLVNLRNDFQQWIGKLNDNSTKEVAFAKLKNLIYENQTQDSLRIFISSLSSNNSISTTTAREFLSLLYGYIASIYKENLMDTLDKPPNIIKTINRLLTHIRSHYLNTNSYVIHKGSSHSICEIYDHCMPKDNIKSIYILFIDPLISLITGGNGKDIQIGAAICLSDFIYHLSKEKNTEINNKILASIDNKIINLINKNTLDNPYIFEALLNLMNGLPFETFINYLKDIYDRTTNILSDKNNKFNYLTKINCLNLLGFIAQNLKKVADISIGYYQEDIIKIIEYNTHDKVYKVQIAAKDALKSWNELSVIFNELENKKEIIGQGKDIAKTKEEYLNKNNENNVPNNYVKKMDKFNFLRNLAKLAKIENQKVDLDSELPEKMKGEVYKKGIGNILKLSSFLKYKNNNANSNSRNNSKNKNNNSNNKQINIENKIKNEINDYLKNSKQVKKYDSNNTNNTLNNNIKDRLTDVNEEINDEQNDGSVYKNNNINQNNNKFNFVEENVGPGTQGVMGNEFINIPNEQQMIYDNISNNFNNKKVENINTEENNIYDNENKNIDNNNNYDNENQNNYNYTNENKNIDNYDNENNNSNNYQNNENNNEDANFASKNIQNIDNINNNSFHKRGNLLPKLNYNNNIYPNKSKINEYNNDTNNNKNKSNRNYTTNNNTQNINNLLQVKKQLKDLITKSLLNNYSQFEKEITSRLYDMETRINDIYLRLNDFQAHPNNNNCNNNKIKNSNISETNESEIYHINNMKFKNSNNNMNNLRSSNSTNKYSISAKEYNMNIDKNKVYTDIMDDVKNELNNRNKKYKEKMPNTDSEITKLWKESLYLIENTKYNEGYELILNGGDDIYLLRLVCITGPIFNLLNKSISKRILMRINMISRSHQIQSLLIKLIKSSLNYHVFEQLSKNEQNDLLDSLFEFSGLNTKLGSEAAELYTKITNK